MSRHVPVGGVYRHVQGWKPSPAKQPGGMRLSAPSPSVLASFPRIMDLSANWPEIRDQGALGSCTANAMLECAGYLYKKAGKPDPVLSRLFLYAATREDEGVPLCEDSGATIPDVLKAFGTHGAVKESDWPYIESQFSIRPPAPMWEEAKQHRGTFWYDCPNLETVLSSLAQGFPVVIGIPCPENLFSAECAKTGQVKDPGPLETFNGGHCIPLLGANLDTGELLFAQSWGPKWGNAWNMPGFGTITFNFYRQYVMEAGTLRSELMPE